MYTSLSLSPNLDPLIADSCLFVSIDFRGYSAESLGDHRSGRNSLHTYEIWYAHTRSILVACLTSFIAVTPS